MLTFSLLRFGDIHHLHTVTQVVHVCRVTVLAIFCHFETRPLHDCKRSNTRAAWARRKMHWQRTAAQASRTSRWLVRCADPVQWWGLVLPGSPDISF